MLNWDRNKRDMVLDLKKPGASEVFLRMAERADMVGAECAPRRRRSPRRGLPSLRGAQSESIRLLLDGGLRLQRPVQNKPAYDGIIQGIAGVMEAQRTGGQPRVVKNILADKVTAMTGAISILAALHAAREEGRGQHIVCALAIVAVAWSLRSARPNASFAYAFRPCHT